MFTSKRWLSWHETIPDSISLYLQISRLHLHGPCHSLPGHSRHQNDSDVGRGGSSFCCTLWFSSILKYSAVHVFDIAFAHNNPDWRHWGVQDLPRYQRREDYQACGVLVHWNLCYDVCIRGLFVYLSSDAVFLEIVISRSCDTVIIRFSLGMQGHVLTRLQKQQLLRTRLWETPELMYQRALTSWAMSSSENWITNNQSFLV